MDAKLTPYMDETNRTRISQWIHTLEVRTSVTLLILVASLTALTLIVHIQYGPLVSGKSLSPAPVIVSQTVEIVPQTVDTTALELEGQPSADELRYRALAAFLAKRYRVSQEITYDLVGHAHEVGRDVGLDPLLIIAVIAIESGFNPIAESVAGAKGLMQVIPKYHTKKLEEFGGEKAVYDPATNIVIGARILKEYVRYTGSLGVALQMYAGALGDSEDQYTNRVMSEKLRLQEALSRAGNRRNLTRTALAHQLQSTALD
jgi:soluble lytic murein transglycosylase-like protein